MNKTKAKKIYKEAIKSETLMFDRIAKMYEATSEMFDGTEETKKVLAEAVETFLPQCKMNDTNALFREIDIKQLHQALTLQSMYKLELHEDTDKVNDMLFYNGYIYHFTSALCNRIDILKDEYDLQRCILPCLVYKYNEEILLINHCFLTNNTRRIVVNHVEYALVLLAVINKIKKENDAV